MLSAGFIGSACQSMKYSLTLLSFAFWLQPVSLIWLVVVHDSSDTSSLSLSIGSCSTGFQIGLPVTAFSPRFTD